MSIPKCKCGRPVEFRGTLLYKFCYDCWRAQDVRNTTPTEKPHKAQAPRSVSEFKPGDRVKIYSPSNQLLMYEGLQRGATGTVRRLIAGMVRVEIDGTGSQDSEGHNSYSDFQPNELTLLTTPTEKPQGAGAVPPRVWIALPKDDGIVPYMHWMKPEIKEEGGELFYRSYPGGPNCWIAVHWIQDFIPEARHKELMERAVGEAKTEEWKAVADELEEIYGTSTGERMALIGHIRDTYKELKAARAASSPGAGEEKV